MQIWLMSGDTGLWKLRTQASSLRTDSNGHDKALLWPRVK